MESTQTDASKKEPMAHKLDTPPELNSSLRNLADKIGESEEEDLVNSLVDFKQNIFEYMNHFDIKMTQVDNYSDSKKQVKGGFGKRAVQEHGFKGANGLRLVRDNLSDKFLKVEEVELYSLLLDRKLVEETRELTETMNTKKRVEELADVLEVFNTILSSKGIDENLIERKRQAMAVQKTRERRKLSKSE